jgi:hypothetical protein
MVAGPSSTKSIPVIGKKTSINQPTTINSNTLGSGRRAVLAQDDPSA